MKRLFILLSVMNGAAHAQTTGTLNPNPAPAQPSANEDVPPGGCMPIGLTAAGEIVFPIQCKDFIEQHRGRNVEQKPAAAEEKPAVAEEQAAAKQPEAGAPENNKPTNQPVETVSSLKLVKHVKKEPRERTRGQDGCQHYRTYDPGSGTYRGYDGQRHSCR
jgi:hypothetical protein